MTSRSNELSLLHFLQDRLKEDAELIIRNTPMFDVTVQDADFEKRFLDRGALWTGLHGIGDRQPDSRGHAGRTGQAPRSRESFVAGPLTELGSRVLKLLAARFEDHPDYQLSWCPEVELPKP